MFIVCPLAEIKSASAGFPLAAAAYPYIATALVGAGIVITTPAGLEAVVQDFWSRASQAAQHNIINAVAIGASSLVLGSALWRDATMYRNSIYSGEFTNISYTAPGIGDWYAMSAGEMYYIADALFEGEIYLTNIKDRHITFYMADSLNSAASQWRINFQTVGVLVSGKVHYVHQIRQNMSGSYVVAWQSEHGMAGEKWVLNDILIKGENNVMKFYKSGVLILELPMTGSKGSYFDGRINNGTGESASVALGTIGGVVSLPVAGNLGVDTKSLNPNYNLDQKKVGVPPLPIDNILNKDTDDLSVSTPSAGEIGSQLDAIPDATEVGLLSGIWSAIQGLNTAIASIAAVLTTGLVGDLTSVNYSKMNNVWIGLTTKFPFSLPWDLKNSVNVFSSGAALGPWTLSVNNPLGGVISFDVVLPQGFMAYFEYMRWALLIIFDIGLIMSTRRLLGGAS